MSKRILAMTAVALVLAFSGSASAIVYGQADGNLHPNVGALLAPHAYSDGTWATCTGTLISSTVFLTAAHCDWGLPRMAVTFDSDYNAPGTTYWGDWHADPRFRGAQGDPYDLAVVVLDDPVPGITPAELPAAGSLSNLSKKPGPSPRSATGRNRSRSTTARPSTTTTSATSPRATSSSRSTRPGCGSR